MASEGQSVEGLRKYVGDLKPEARALLIAELERGLLRGDDVPGANLILQELRRTIRELAHPPPRIGSPARLFFKPIEPFLVDDDFNHKHPGRIARAVLEPIWAWTCRDLLAAEAKAFSDEVSQALLTGDTEYSEWLTGAFQDQAVRKYEKALASIEGDEMAGRRLAGQIRIPGALKVTNQVLVILKSRDALAALGARLPDRIDNLADEQLEKVKMLLDEFSGKKPHLFLHALLLVMSRLAAPWQLIRLAVAAAETDIADLVAEGPYAVAVTIVLAEMERLIVELKTELKGRGVGVVFLLKNIHDASRGFRTEMDLLMDSEWGRQLAAMRAGISNVLKAEIESMPGRVRHLLRPRPAEEIYSGSVLDADDVAEVEALVGFVGACRKYAGELAVNEVTQSIFLELQQCLEAGTPGLLEGLRTAREADRPFRQSQIDAAVRISAKAFGEEYASLLAKAAEVAAHSKRRAAVKA